MWVYRFITGAKRVLMTFRPFRHWLHALKCLMPHHSGGKNAPESCRLGTQCAHWPQGSEWELVLVRAGMLYAHMDGMNYCILYFGFGHWRCGPKYAWICKLCCATGVKKVSRFPSLAVALQPPLPRAWFAKRPRSAFPRVDSIFMILALGSVQGPVGAPPVASVFQH